MDESVVSAEGLGNRIRATRREHGIRQEDLAEAIGSSHRFLRDLERGKASQVQRLFAVLDELGLRLTIDVPPAATSRGTIRKRGAP